VPARRGTRLLLEHCAQLQRLTSGQGRSARERLETALGADLVRVLLSGLTGDHRPPPPLALLP
jgi:hypothetical protein